MASGIASRSPTLMDLPLSHTRNTEIVVAKNVMTAPKKIMKAIATS